MPEGQRGTERHRDHDPDQTRDHETKTGLGLVHSARDLLVAVVADGEQRSVELASALARAVLEDAIVPRAEASSSQWSVFGAVGACNSGTGDCPRKAAVVAGASCSDEHLQCAYDLTTPAAECDGTSTVIATSCTCTDGTWSCPSATECESGASADDGGAEASPDEAGDNDSGGSTG